MKIAGAAILFLAFESPKVDAFSAYLSTLNGPAAYAKSSYAIAQGKPAPTPVTTGNDYINTISGPESVLKAPLDQYIGSQQQPVASFQPGLAASTAATGASYLNALSGASTPSTKKPSYTGFNNKPKAAESGNDYLGRLATGPSDVLRAAPSSVGSTQQPQSYTAPPQVKLSTKPASYSPFNSKPKPVESGSSYLSALTGASPTRTYTPVSLEAAAPTVSSNGGDYMSQLSSSVPQGRRMKTASYSGFNTKPKAPENGSDYLSRLAAGSTEVSRSAPPAVGSLPQSISYSSTPAAKVSSKPASYSPFGGKPKAVAESGYLGNLVANPSTSTVSSSVAIPQVTATRKPASYSPFGEKPKAVAQTGYLGNLDASPSVVSTVSVPASGTSVNSVATKATMTKASYSPFGQKPKAVANTGYLGDLVGVAVASTISKPTASTKRASYSPFGEKPKAVAESGYLGGLAGASIATTASSPLAGAASTTPSKPASYSPFGEKPKAVASTGYLGGLSGASVTPSGSGSGSSVAGATAVTSSTKRASYSPFGEKPKAVASTGYLGGLAGSSVTPSVSAPTVSGPVVTTKTNMKSASYSPFGEKPKAVVTPGYLGNLGASSATSTVSAAATTAASPTLAATSVKRASYSPFGEKPKAVVTPGYLGNLVVSPASTVSAPVAASPTLTTSSAKRASYSPFGEKPKAVATSGYLGSLVGGVVSLTSTASAPVAAKRANYSPFGSKPQAVVTQGYLGNLVGGGSSMSYATVSAPVAAVAAPTPKAQPVKSYSPFGSKPKAVASTGYLGNLVGSSATSSAVAAPAATTTSAVRPASPSSYSPFGKKPLAPETKGDSYLGGLAGVTTVSSSASWSSPASVPAAAVSSSKPAASFSGFGTKPKAVATTGYLGAL